MLSLYCLAVLIHLAGTTMNLNRKLLTLSVALIPGYDDLSNEQMQDVDTLRAKVGMKNYLHV